MGKKKPCYLEQELAQALLPQLQPQQLALQQVVVLVFLVVLVVLVVLEVINLK